MIVINKNHNTLKKCFEGEKKILQVIRECRRDSPVPILECYHAEKWPIREAGHLLPSVWLLGSTGRTRGTLGFQDGRTETPLVALLCCSSCFSFGDFVECRALRVPRALFQGRIHWLKAPLCFCEQQAEPLQFRAGCRAGSQPRWELGTPCFQPRKLFTLPFSSVRLANDFFIFIVRFKASTGVLCSRGGGRGLTVVLCRCCFALGDIQLLEWMPQVPVIWGWRACSYPCTAGAGLLLWKRGCPGHLSIGFNFLLTGLWWVWFCLFELG